MKTLTTYIISNSIYSDLNECLDAELNIVNEGKFISAISKLFKKHNNDDTNKNVYNKAFKDDTETKQDLATAQVVAAAQKDPEIRKIADKTFGRIVHCDTKEEAIQELINWGELTIRKGVLVGPELAMSVRNVLRNQKDNKEAQEMAEKLDSLINDKYPEQVKTSEKKLEKIENTVVKTKAFKNISNNPDSEETGEEEKTDNSTLGITDDGEGKAVTPKQEEEAVSDAITDDKNFFLPLAKEAGVDGNNLRDAIIGLINDSLKNKTTDKEGNTVYKWKTDTKGFQTKNEDKLIKGLGAVLCGLMMINHKGMNEKIVDVLIDTGFSRNDYLSNLTKSDNE